jgi:hypothetical protein
MSNKGYKVEQALLENTVNSASVRFKKLDGSYQIFPVADRVLYSAKTTRSKWDLVINPSTRLQVKSTSSNRACVVNMVPVRNLYKLADREMIDVQLALDVMQLLVETGKPSVRLAEIANVNDWQDMLVYLLFEGTPTAQEIPSMQANYLLDVEADLENAVIIEKNQAIPYIWENLVAEIRTRKGKTEPCLHVRYK